MQYISAQQREIVRSPAKYKLINGCAGSRKTDTLVKCVVSDLTRNARPILILTLVGSVTDEIKSRVELALGIELIQQRSGQYMTNNYIGEWNDTTICVSNYDAWIQHMLKTNSTAPIDGADFNGKIDTLLDISRSSAPMIVTMRTNEKVGLLLLDEAQDLRGPRMEILTNCAIKSPDMDFYIGGDYLQTIFASDDPSVGHPMDVFADALTDHTYFDLNVCRRCPLAHVRFNNALMFDTQLEYGIPPMESDNDNLADRPILFSHLPMSGMSNGDARINAEQITDMLGYLMDADPTVTPADIAIIMTRTNDSVIFDQLADTLGRMFVARGWPEGLALHMHTRADGSTNPLDWGSAKGRAIMLSIHGDKGRGHRCVIWPGCSKGAIPNEASVGLTSRSLFNVATTRSTKYLFIGTNRATPSPYLTGQWPEVEALTYPIWKPHEDLPEPYRSIIRRSVAEHGTNEPDSAHRVERRPKLGKQSKLSITDVARDFDHSATLWPATWPIEPAKIVFGERQPIVTESQDINMIIGIMTELLIRRSVAKAQLVGHLLKYTDGKEVIYTDDERYLSFMHDLRDASTELGPIAEAQIYVKTRRMYFAKHKEMARMLKQTVTKGQRVVHRNFSTPAFHAHLDAFISDCPNAALLPACCWNVALYFNQISQKTYRPAFNLMYDRFDADIAILHENVRKYVDLQLTDRRLTFELPLAVTASLNSDELKIAMRAEHHVSIKGRCDIWDKLAEHLIEIKASGQSQCAQSWITQALMYVLLLGTHRVATKRLTIVNILEGALYTWELPDMRGLRDVIGTIADKYKWHEIERSAMVRQLDRIDEFLSATGPIADPAT